MRFSKVRVGHENVGTAGWFTTSLARLSNEVIFQLSKSSATSWKRNVIFFDP